MANDRKKRDNIKPSPPFEYTSGPRPSLDTQATDIKFEQTPRGARAQ